MHSQLLPFVGTAIVIALTSGADTALLCNLLNPKAGIFSTALLPQFVSPQDPALAVSLLLTAIAALTSLLWLTVYATLVPRAGDILRRQPVRRALDRVTGTVPIGLGLRLALSRH